MARVEGRVLQAPAIQYRGDQRVSFMSIHTVMYTYNCACKCNCPYIAASQLFGLVNFAAQFCVVLMQYIIMSQRNIKTIYCSTFLQCKN